MSISEETKLWIASAERDRDTVEILQTSNRPPYEIIAYHCQQCAEKYLKAIFIERGRKPPYVHDLLKLNRDCAEFCHELESVESDCERLTPFGTITRYPGSIMEPSAAHMPWVTGWMENIRNAVQSCLSKPNV
ncbi:MAG: HEPN domain-containing protein [Spirochaeta sp.]|nr:HEPN domain-containing protein [Spirochaeta sp.]